MTRQLTRHLTFANTCSVLALTVALGTGTAYAANTVRSVDIVNGQVRAVDLATNAVTTSKIKPGEVRAPDLGTGAVETRVLRDGSVTTDDVADGTLGNADIGPSAVGSSEVAADAVGASEVADNAIDGGEVVNNSLTGNDLADDSVGAGEIANNAVGSANVVNESLTFADIVGGGATGNVQVPTGYVPNGRCRALDFGVGGAAVGDAVVFSGRAPIQDGVYFYATNVPTAGTVRGGLCNLSGVTQVAITDYPVRIITFH